MINFDSIKVVRCRAGSKQNYSLRVTNDENMEIEIYACESINEANKIANLIRSLTETNAPSRAAIAISALLSILPLARMVGDSHNDVGQQGYATKSHMVEWGRDIWQIATDAIEQIEGKTDSSIQESPQETPPPSEDDSEEWNPQYTDLQFSVGDRVFHQKFGEGTVRVINKNKLYIDFDRVGNKGVLHWFCKSVETEAAQQ